MSTRENIRLIARDPLISVFFLGLSSTEQMIRSCADPESFFRGGPTFFTPTLFFIFIYFLVD